MPIPENKPYWRGNTIFPGLRGTVAGQLVFQLRKDHCIFRITNPQVDRDVLIDETGLDCDTPVPRY